MRRGRGDGASRLAAVLLAGALLSACAGRSAPSRFAGGREAGQIRLEVDNRNYSDVVVFGLQGATAIRLGSVTGLTSKTLAVPDHLVVAGQLRLLVDPIGSAAAYLSDEIMVNPGDVVVLHVGSLIRQSSWLVRAGEG